MAVQRDLTVELPVCQVSIHSVKGEVDPESTVETKGVVRDTVSLGFSNFLQYRTVLIHREKPMDSFLDATLGGCVIIESEF